MSADHGVSPLLAEHVAHWILTRTGAPRSVGACGLGASLACRRDLAPLSLSMRSPGRPGRWFAGVAVVIAFALAVLAVVLTRVPATPSLPTLVTNPGYALGGRGDDAWISAGLQPGQGTRWTSMSRAALRDLHRLTPAPPLFGGPAAGAGEAWGLTWPRDASFTAVAMARTGHAAEAVTILAFLQDVQSSTGGFAARYQLNGREPLDPRDDQTDGAGWVLWALDAVSREASPASRLLLLRRNEQLLERATECAQRQLDPDSHLPSASPDYWEHREADLTLGTAAPLVAGLQAAARMYRDLDVPERATAAAAHAEQLQGAILARFGSSGYQRYGDHGGVDAAVAFLAPPFLQPGRGLDVRSALTTYERTAFRISGGLAPGAGWRDDGVSWTPETALVALAAAELGDRRNAERWLDWLDHQRVAWGSLPEKVRPDGQPAGPAPLAWTSALVLLTLDRLIPSAGKTAPRLSDDAVRRVTAQIDASLAIVHGA